MTRKIVKRSTFFAPHCPNLCCQILKNYPLNSFWPKMQQNQLRQYWGWQGDCQQYRGRWRRGRSHHFEKFPLLLRHLLWKGPLDGQRVDIGWCCSCCKHSNCKPNEMHVPFFKCGLKSHIWFLLLNSFFVFINQPSDSRFNSSELMSTLSILTWRGGQPWSWRWFL